MMAKLQLIYFNKSKLIKLEGNPRRIVDPEAKAKLQKLIKHHGFQNPLQVFKEANGKFSILCGNHRYDAGIAMGMTDFPCIVYEGDRNQAIARAISDNKSSEWTDWDIPMLKDTLVELDDGEMDIGITGFEEQEVKGLFENWDPAKGKDDIGDYDPDKDGYTIKIGTVLQKDRDEVLSLIDKALKKYEYDIKAV